jgi:hypothetical protein
MTTQERINASLQREIDREVAMSQEKEQKEIDYKERQRRARIKLEIKRENQELNDTINTIF